CEGATILAFSGTGSETQPASRQLLGGSCLQARSTGRGSTDCLRIFPPTRRGSKSPSCPGRERLPRDKTFVPTPAVHPEWKTIAHPSQPVPRILYDVLHPSPSPRISRRFLH